MKWFYFEHSWRDAPTWKDAKQPRRWLPNGKKALYSLWDEYQFMELSPGELQICGEKRCREKSPNEFELATDMTLIQPVEEVDELDAWISSKCFHLDDGDTLPKFWLH
jgi:hypothetical protein